MAQILRAIFGVGSRAGGWGGKFFWFFLGWEMSSRELRNRCGNWAFLISVFPAATDCLIGVGYSFMQQLKVLANKGVAGGDGLKFSRLSGTVAGMNNPPRNATLLARWHEYLRQQSQVGYEKLWLMGLSAATLLTGVGMWLLLSSK